MAFNYSFSFGFLTQTSIRNHNDAASTISEPVASTTSGNIRITIYPHWYKHIAIEWSIPSDWGNCRFNVYYSQSEEGPFKRITPAPVDSNYLLDSESHEFFRFNRGFYLVEAILLDQGNAVIKSIPKTWGAYQNSKVKLRSNEIQRREYLLLSKFTGIKSYLFRKRTFGQRCPECWNATTEKALKDNCKTCYGTTFKGGYFPASQFFAQYEPNPNALLRTYFGLFEPNQIGAWTISLPEMHSGDIIIRLGDWDTYRIENISATELQGNTVRQILQLTQLSKSDIEYSLIENGVKEFPEEYL